MNGAITGLTATASSNLSAEASRAASVEAVISSNLSIEVSRAGSVEGSLDNRLSVEISRATSTEGSLDTRVSAEESARLAGDASLTTRVSAEETARASAATSLTTRVSAEESTRLAADTSLTTRVSAEESTRLAADTSLSSRISIETSRATSVEVSLNAELIALPDTDGLTIEVNATDNKVRLMQTVAPAKDNSGNTTFRQFQGETKFSGTTTFNGYLAKMSAQPNTLSGFDDFSLITKGYFDSIYTRKNTVTGSVNGTNAAFTFGNPVKSGSEAVYLNGLLQSVTDDYTVTTNGSGQVTAITFVVAPDSGSNLKVYGVY